MPVAKSNSNAPGPHEVRKLEYILRRVHPAKSTQARKVLSSYSGTSAELFRFIEEEYDTILPSVYDAVHDFYGTYNPEKQGEVESVLDAWSGLEGKLVEALSAKYDTNFFLSRWPALVRRISIRPEAPLPRDVPQHTPHTGRGVLRPRAARGVSPSTLSPPRPGARGLQGGAGRRDPPDGRMPAGVRKQILGMFTRHAPQKVPEVCDLLALYEGRSGDKLLALLQACWERPDAAAWGGGPPPPPTDSLTDTESESLPSIAPTELESVEDLALFHSLVTMLPTPHKAPPCQRTVSPVRRAAGSRGHHRPQHTHSARRAPAPAGHADPDALFERQRADQYSREAESLRAQLAQAAHENSTLRASLEDRQQDRGYPWMGRAPARLDDHHPHHHHVEDNITQIHALLTPGTVPGTLVAGLPPPAAPHTYAMPVTHHRGGVPVAHLEGGSLPDVPQGYEESVSAPERERAEQGGGVDRFIELCLEEADQKIMEAKAHSRSSSKRGSNGNSTAAADPPARPPSHPRRGSAASSQAQASGNTAQDHKSQATAQPLPPPTPSEPHEVQLAPPSAPESQCGSESAARGVLCGSAASSDAPPHGSFAFPATATLPMGTTPPCAAEPGSAAVPPPEQPGRSLHLFGTTPAPAARHSPLPHYPNSAPPHQAQFDVPDGIGPRRTPETPPASLPAPNTPVSAILLPRDAASSASRQSATSSSRQQRAPPPSGQPHRSLPAAAQPAPPSQHADTVPNTAETTPAASAGGVVARPASSTSSARGSRRSRAGGGAEQASQVSQAVASLVSEDTPTFGGEEGEVVSLLSGVSQPLGVGEAAAYTPVLRQAPSAPASRRGDALPPPPPSQPHQAHAPTPSHEREGSVPLPQQHSQPQSGGRSVADIHSVVAQSLHSSAAVSLRQSRASRGSSGGHARPAAPGVGVGVAEQSVVQQRVSRAPSAASSGLHPLQRFKSLESQEEEGGP